MSLETTLRNFYCCRSNIFSLRAVSAAFCVQKAKTSKYENKQARTCQPSLATTKPLGRWFQKKPCLVPSSHVKYFWICMHISNVISEQLHVIYRSWVPRTPSNRKHWRGGMNIYIWITFLAVYTGGLRSPWITGPLTESPQSLTF